MVWRSQERSARTEFAPVCSPCWHGCQVYLLRGQATRHFGDIRAHLSSQGTPIGPYDLQIAAIAVAHDLTVVTQNTREFARAPGLKLEDWLL